LARAQNNLGVMYDDGNVLTPTLRGCLLVYQGGGTGIREAQKNLGSMYQEGRGLAKDYVQAAKWFA